MIRENSCVGNWIEIYPVDSVLHLFNTWGQVQPTNALPNGVIFVCGRSILLPHYLKPHLATLNKWNQLVTSCRHVSKFLLKNFKSAFATR